MKSIYTIFLSLIFLQLADAQEVWQEHLSHDRIAYAHHGHFITYYGDVYLLMGNIAPPMNTSEVIIGNKKKAALRVLSEQNFYTSKSVRLSKIQNQTTLENPWNYNVPGHGVYSIIQLTEKILDFRELQNIGENTLPITNALIPVDPFKEKYCITSENKWYGLNYANEINWTENIEGELDLHLGLNNKPYKISNGFFSSIDNPESGYIEIGTYDKLDNNPFHNELIEIEHSTINRYSFDDFSLVSSDVLEGVPIDYLFVENGFYYLIETNLYYTIYFFSDETSKSEKYYELQKSNEISDFTINEFNIRGNDIFFMGLWNDTRINNTFSYVQKRILDQEYSPIRKDLELTNVVVNPKTSNSNNQIDYEYSCTVTNLSDEVVNSFTIYSEKLESMEFESEKHIKNDVTLELGPGESIEVKGEFTYEPISSLTFHIVGVDFAIDNDTSNNSFTADVGLVSNTDISQLDLTISPNPCYEYLTISDEIKNIESISILNNLGQNMNIPIVNYYDINVSTLTKGQYWIQVNTKTKNYKQAFIKI